MSKLILKDVMSKFRNCLLEDCSEDKFESEETFDIKSLNTKHKGYLNYCKEIRQSKTFEKSVLKFKLSPESIDPIELLKSIRTVLQKDINNEKINSGSDDDKFRKALAVEFLIHIYKCIDNKSLKNGNKEFRLFDSQYEDLKNILNSTVNILDRFTEIFINMYVGRKYADLIKDFNSKVGEGVYSFPEGLLLSCDNELNFRHSFYDEYLKTKVDKVSFYSSGLAVDRNLNTHDAAIKADFKNDEDVENSVLILSSDEKIDISDVKLSDDEAKQIKGSKNSLIYSFLYAHLVYEEMTRLGYGKMEKILDKKMKDTFKPLDSYRKMIENSKAN